MGTASCLLNRPNSSTVPHLNHEVLTQTPLTLLLQTGLSRLNYTPASDLDYGTISCWARNTIDSQKTPCLFQIVAAGVLTHYRNLFSVLVPLITFPNTFLLKYFTFPVFCRKNSIFKSKYLASDFFITKTAFYVFK